MKKISTALLLLVLGYAALCLHLFLSQRDKLYYPTAVAQAENASWFELTSDKELLRVWRTGSEAAKAVIYFGGNAEDVAHNIPRFNRAFGDYSIYLPNYRGYGGSTGRPTEHGLFNDALTLYDYLSSRHSNISVIGRSLGSGVATYVAASRNVEKLILVTPYDSIERVAQDVYPFFPIALLLLDKYDSLSRVKDIRAATLVILAEQDQIIPRKNSQTLIEAFPAEQVTTRVIPDTEHNYIGRTPEYARLLGEFL